MKKKLIAITLAVIAICALMYTEYRYIMVNIHPYYGEGNTLYLEVFDRVDEYSVEDEFQIDKANLVDIMDRY